MALRDLYISKQISYEDALSKSSKPDDLAMMIGPTGMGAGAPAAAGHGAPMKK
jgi:hypothetical protein